jgi:hypothetical protein
VEPKLDSLKEDLFLVIGVLLGMNDVAAVTEDEIGYRRHDALAVGAGQE